MSYQLNPDFERTAVLLSLRSKNFWLRMGNRLQPDELNLPLHQLALRLCRAVAADHGWPEEELLIQRAALWMNEGSATEQELMDLAALLEGKPYLDPERAIDELVAPVRLAWSQAITRKVLDRYKNGGKFGPSLIEELVACDNLGQPMAETEVKAREFGEDTEEVLANAPMGIRIKTGFEELDMLFGGGWPLGTLWTVLMDSKAGKCCRFGTPTLLHSGQTVKVEDVKVGDCLVGPDGTPRRVLSTVRGRALMYEVRPAKGASFQVNEDHILTLANMGSPNHGPRRDLGWVDVSVKEWMGWNRHKKAQHQLIRSGPVEFAPGPGLPIDPYFLGVMLGDGHLKHGNVSVTTADSEILECFMAQAEEHNMRVRFDWKDGQASAFFMIGKGREGNVMKQKLVDLGVYGSGAGEKFIPDIYKFSTVANRFQILAGLIDTDGCLDKLKYDYISKSQRLANDVVFVARSLGLSAYVKPCKKKCQTGAEGTYYRVAIGGDTALVPCRIPRKQAPFRQRGEHRENRLDFDVIPVGEVADYAGFNLDGDGRYLLGDFTVTHNSMVACYMAACGILQGENAGYLSLELPESEIHKRVLAAIVGVTINELEDPKTRREALLILASMKKTRKIGRLFVTKLEAGTVDVLAVQAWFKFQEQAHDVRIRYRVVDYGDLVESFDRSDRESAYNKGKTVWQGLANMAQNKEEPNWVLVPTQSKRPAWKIGQPIPVLTRTDVADSHHKTKITDFLITMTPQPDLRAEQGHIVYVDADRFFGQTGTPIGPLPHQRAMGRMASMAYLIG